MSETTTETKTETGTKTDSILEHYRAADSPLPESYNLWPLYGAGFENLGDNGGMKRVPTPEPGPE